PPWIMSEVPDAFREIAERMVQVTPQAAALGLQFVSVAPARGSLAAPWRQARAAAAGTEPFPTATLDLRIDYMRAAAPRSGVTCEAHCYKITRSIGFVRAEAWDVDRSDLVATAQAAFVVNRLTPELAAAVAERRD